MSLSNKAILVNLHITGWTGRKIDRKAGGTVETAYSTKGRVGNYTKQLLPNGRELTDVTNATGNLRRFFYYNTLPWFSDGSRILSSKNYMDFTTEYRSKKAQFDQAVQNFLDAYPKLKESAKLALAHLYSESDYPTIEELKKSFTCALAFMPMPDIADFRTEILETEKSDFLNRMKEVESNALKDCYLRLHEVVTKAVERLKNPESKITESLIGSVTDICGLLPKLNVNDDAKLEQMRKEVEIAVNGLTVSGLQSSIEVRKDAASQLDAINSKMAAFMGG